MAKNLIETSKFSEQGIEQFYLIKIIVGKEDKIG